jgi:hypothetical protein
MDRRVDSSSGAGIRRVVEKGNPYLFNHIWKERRLERCRPDGGAVLEAAHAYCRENFRHDDIARGANEWIKGYVRTLVPFLPEEFPSYPKLLIPYLTRPNYRIIYRDGRIDDRETGGAD